MVLPSIFFVNPPPPALCRRPPRRGSTAVFWTSKKKKTSWGGRGCDELRQKGCVFVLFLFFFVLVCQRVRVCFVHDLPQKSTPPCFFFVTLFSRHRSLKSGCHWASLHACLSACFGCPSSCSFCKVDELYMSGCAAKSSHADSIQPTELFKLLCNVFERALLI